MSESNRPGSSSNSQPPALFAALTRKSRTSESGNSAADAQAAAKATRRQLLEQVRNDWFYEPPSSTSAVPSASSLRPDLHFNVTDWKPREQADTSCSDQAEDERNTTSGFTVNCNRDPYRFESPDALGQYLLERKRKRRKVEEEEMQWNDGLRTWVERRDAWTGAKPPSSARQPDATPKPSNDGSISSSHDIEDGEKMTDAEAPGTTAPDLDSCASPSQQAHTVDSASAMTVPESEETLVPVVQPDSLFGDHTQSSIKPNAYSTIYSRLIVQSNSPTVPINLKHVTRALVHGWKQNGEWPPKPSRLEPSVAKRRNSKAENSAVSNPHPETKGANTELGAEPKTKRSGSIGGAVKKVFNLTSGRRFHIRNSSRECGGQGPEGP